eukprot:Sdes_comp15687_c0_seq1m4712
MSHRVFNRTPPNSLNRKTNSLHLQILFNPWTSFAPNPTLLPSTKRNILTTKRGAIHTHPTTLQLLRDSIHSGQVPRIKVAGQACIHLIGDSNHLILARESIDGSHWPENLLIVNIHLRGAFVQNGGLEKGSRAWDFFAPNQDFRTHLYGTGNEPFHLFYSPLVDQRPHFHLGLVKRPHHQGRNLLHKELHKLCVDRFMNKYPIGRNTHLARISKPCRNGPRNGRFEISILENYERRVASQFERQFFHRGCRFLIDDFPHRAGARKRDRLHKFTPTEYLANSSHRISRAADNVEHPGRKPCSATKLPQSGHAQRRLFGWLQYTRAACSNRSHKLSHRCQVGIVPGSNQRTHANGLFQDVVALISDRIR